MIELKLAVMILSSGLFFWGGHSFLAARRWIMPFVLAVSCVFFAHSLMALTQLSASIFLSLGYGDNSLFRRIFGDSFGRGIWGALVGLSLSLGLFLTGHIYLPLFVGYLIVSFACEAFLKDLNQLIGDPIIGAGFGLIVFLIH